MSLMQYNSYPTEFLENSGADDDYCDGEGRGATCSLVGTAIMAVVSLRARIRHDGDTSTGTLLYATS